MNMNPLQIIFLYDLNAYSDLRPRSGPELNRKLLCLRLSCLRILTHFSNSVPSLRWGFKFFDSRGKITQTMCKFFFPSLTLESYETFENEITSQFLRHASYLEVIAESSDQNQTLCDSGVSLNQDKKSTPPVQLLQLALKEMLGEFHWESSVDTFSPCVRSRCKKVKRNLLFYVSRCPRNEKEFHEFFVSDSLVNSMKLSKLLLSHSLKEQLLDQASVQWIWLNTSENLSSCENLESEILKLLSKALKSIDCTLIPLSALSQPTQILKIKKGITNESTDVCNIKELYSSLLPFSTVFQNSISYPFCSNDMNILNYESTIVFNQRDDTIPVLVNSIPLYWNRDDNLTEAPYRSSTKFCSRIIVYFPVPRCAQVKSSDMHLCVPNMSTNTLSYQIFQDLNVGLFTNNINLFIVCESSCGTKTPGLYTPLTNTSAIISIFTKSCYFLTEGKGTNTSFNDIKDSSFLEVQKKAEKYFPSLAFNDCIDFLKHPDATSNQVHRPYQLEGLENWFQPASSVPSTFTEINAQVHLKNSSAVEDFESLVKSVKEEDVKEESVELLETKENPRIIVDEEIPKDIRYEDLIENLLEMFNSILENNGNSLHTAKRIVRYASSFFLQKSITSYEENLKSFMSEFFLTTCRKLNDKYSSSEDFDTSKKTIIECQMQVYLNLEMEILFPSLDGSTCVKMVTDFLRTMSFFSGATELNKFIFEVLKPNYGHNLLPILIEVGEELDIPFNSDEDSFDEISEPRSYQSMHDNLDSATSLKSASSIPSNKSENKRLPRKRSDISDARKSHQVLLPTKSPRKKKVKSSYSVEKIPIRYSPRLYSKKRKEFRNVDTKPESVRRNLFPKDKKPQTPLKNKYQTTPSKRRKPTTPKGHHVLKTRFVQETPDCKQKHSAIYRRLSLADVTPSKEVANSPSITKKAKDNSHLKLLKQLKEKQSKQATIPQPHMPMSLPSTSYHVAKTPQSKNRLSLKLFSRFLTSPTARIGFKKCSKRLFEEDSPRAESESKRRKLFEGQE